MVACDLCQIIKDDLWSIPYKVGSRETFQLWNDQIEHRNLCSKDEERPSAKYEVRLDESSETTEARQGVRAKMNPRRTAIDSGRWVARTDPADLQWSTPTKMLSKRWKEQTRELLKKNHKPEDEPSSFRPICLLFTIGKLLERQKLKCH